MRLCDTCTLAGILFWRVICAVVACNAVFGCDIEGNNYCGVIHCWQWVTVTHLLVSNEHESICYCYLYGRGQSPFVLCEWRGLWACYRGATAQLPSRSSCCTSLLLFPMRVFFSAPNSVSLVHCFDVLFTLLTLLYMYTELLCLYTDDLVSVYWHSYVCILSERGNILVSGLFFLTVS